MSPEEIASLVEFTEADAYEDIYRSAPPDVAGQLQLGLRRFGSARARLMGRVDATLFNAVVGLGLQEPATEQMLNDIINFYEPYGNRYMVQISPLAQPRELSSWLEARGFRYRDHWVKMYRGPEPPPPVSTDLQVRAVSAGEADLFAGTVMKGFEFPADLSALAALVSAGIGRPGWRHYLAYDGQTPVATGGLYVKDGLGWCGYGSTLPAYRRRGAQGAMFARRIADGIELGCRWLVTETDTETPDRPSPSYRNMARSGFTLAYNRPNYVRGHAPEVSG